MVNREQIREGMTVRNTGGRWLGKVEAVGPESFVVRWGHVIHQHVEFEFVDVREVHGDDLVVLPHGELPDELKGPTGESVVSHGQAHE